MKNLLYLIVVCVFFTNCSVSIPENYTESSDPVKIYPDNKDVVIPYNIAPLNFRIETDADEYITCIQGVIGKPLLFKGKTIQINLDNWHRLLEANKGKEITYRIYLKTNNKWYQHPPFSNTVADEPIDEYLSYRLIPPSYKFSSKLSICQRNITNFKEKDIYNNQILSETKKNQCINCHAYQNYRTDNMQFHVRGIHGGTMIVSDGKTKKVNLKAKELISTGVYPAWHPTQKLIAYSVNNTHQRFYIQDIQKVEVQDSNSDLILYDVNSDKVSIIQNNPNSLETFPSWSPDGKMLYFVSAHFPFIKDIKEREATAGKQYKNIKYDIIRMPFDPETKKFGNLDTVFKASAINKSATFPRVSPDGKYLLFTLGDYGTFHIWHTSSDLHLIDLQTSEERKLENVNSSNVESYHT